jgi:hypothetical protein
MMLQLERRFSAKSTGMYHLAYNLLNAGFCGKRTDVQFISIDHNLVVHRTHNKRNDNTRMRRISLNDLRMVMVEMQTV